jgi:hypothetical protein
MGCGEFGVLLQKSNWNSNGFIEAQTEKKSFQLEISLNSNWIFSYGTTKLGYIAKFCGLDSSTTYS